MPAHESALPERIAELARAQKANNGLRQACPRCGQMAIKPRLHTNALSRAADIYVCDTCGNLEALSPKNPGNLDGWAAAGPDFRLLPEDAPGEPARVDDLKCGTECWAWTYDWPRGLSLPVSSMQPTRGVLARTNQDIGAPHQSPAWFVPYVQNTRKPAWTKAVRAEAVNLCSDKDGAVKAHDQAVRAAIARFADLAGMAEKDLAEKPPARSAALAAAGRAGGDGRYGWACVLVSENATSVMSGYGTDMDTDDYKATMAALDFAAKAASAQGITDMSVWSEQQVPESRPDFFHGGVVLKTADGSPELDGKMRRFMEQAMSMAAEQLRYSQDIAEA